MKNKALVIIAIMVGLVGCLILINGLVNENKRVDASESALEVSNTTFNSTPSTTSTTKVKTTKKVVKTTKKKTTKKVVKRVKTASYNEYQQYAKSYGNYDDTQMNCLITLWNHESGWNPNNVNKSSGACGIPQAKPCNKIKKVEGSNDWKAQIRWGIKYINYRYKTPCGAWSHFVKKHWY